MDLCPENISDIIFHMIDNEEISFSLGKTIYKVLFFKHSPNSAFLRLSAINNKTKKRVLYDFTISLTETDIENNTQQNSKSFQIKDSTNKNKEFN